MISYVDYYPAENQDKIPQAVWTKFVAAAIKVAGADGFSAAEESALGEFLHAKSLPKTILEEARKLSEKSLKELLGGQEALKVIAPYLVRDVLRLAMADGSVSDKEKTVMSEFAAELGLTPGQIANISESVKLYYQGLALWQGVVRA